MTSVLTYPAAGLSVLDGEAGDEAAVVDGDAEDDDEGGDTEPDGKVSWEVKTCRRDVYWDGLYMTVPY